MVLVNVFRVCGRLASSNMLQKLQTCERPVRETVRLNYQFPFLTNKAQCSLTAG